MSVRHPKLDTLTVGREGRLQLLLRYKGPVLDVNRGHMKVPIDVPFSQDDLSTARAEWLAATRISMSIYQNSTFMLTYIAHEKSSLKNVVHASKCQMAQGDPWNFVGEENLTCGKLPLKLWPDDLNQFKKEQVLGDKIHFAPPRDERARLARTWLYIHATYDCISMTKAQITHLPDIIELAKNTPPNKSEIDVAKKLEDITGTRNPLILDRNPARWYDNPLWCKLVGCMV